MYTSYGYESYSWTMYMYTYCGFRMYMLFMYMYIKVLWLHNVHIFMCMFPIMVMKGTFGSCACIQSIVMKCDFGSFTCIQLIRVTCGDKSTKIIL